MDLTQFGGLPNATVRGLVVEHGGTNPFIWNTFDHLRVNEAMPDIPLNTQNVNPWHGNAIEIDRDGNYLVSFRNSDMIVKINSQTGNIIWRWGGRNNQFAFINDVFNGFSHQHAVRRLDNGNIILFDNGNLHSPQVSRAAEYKLDENNKTATLVWQYVPSPSLYGSALGYAQRLANGNTLICFGTAQRIIEVDMSGAKRWELLIEEPQRYSYRAFKINSLY
jgi:outer membrane protein assembly factor BamB